MSNRWKIWYTDGSTFSSGDGGPMDAPTKPVALMHVEDGRCGRRVLKYKDWYRWDENAQRWFDCEEFDVLFAITQKGYVIARRGEYQRDNEFEPILIAAHEDDFVPAISPSEPAHPAWRY